MRILFTMVVLFATFRLQAQTIDALKFVQRQYCDKGNIDAGLDELLKIYEAKTLTLQSDSTATCYLLYYLLNEGLRLKNMYVSQEKVLLAAEKELIGVSDKKLLLFYSQFVYYNLALLYDRVGSYFKACHYAQMYCNSCPKEEIKSDKYANCLVMIASNDNRRYDRESDTEKKYMDEALKMYLAIDDDSKATTELVIYKLRLAKMYAGLNCVKEFREIEKNMLIQDTAEFSSVPFALRRIRHFMYIRNSMFALADNSISKEDIDKAADDGLCKLMALYYLNKDSFNVYLPLVFNAYYNYILSNTNVLSQKKMEDIWERSTTDLQFINGMVLHKFPTPENLLKVYDNILFIKNFSYVRNHNLRVFLNEHNDLVKVQDKEVSLSNLKLGKDEFSFYQSIRKKIRKDEVLIEFVKEVYSENVTKSPKTTIGALVCRSFYKYPVYIRLCNSSFLRELLAKNKPDTLYAIDNHLLYDSLVAKVIPCLKGAKSISYSSVGIMNNINLALISDGSKRLNELYHVRFLSSTANVIHLRKMDNDYKTACLFGGIDYNESSESELRQKFNRDRSGFDFLVASKEEVDSIGNILLNANIDARILEGDIASESAIKALSGNAPDILHISTHGGYLKDVGIPKYLKMSLLKTFEDQSMSRNYLLFSGANASWNGKHSRGKIDDGIVTAAEIGQLDFSKNKLTVLSACETGLGDTSFSDGVYGLQRGFKLAGAETLVMTLWKVNDEVAKDFMLVFYRKLVSGKNRFQDFLEAQKIIRKKYPSPSDWGSFIMMD